MANNKLAIIGGSGLYDVEEFKESYPETYKWQLKFDDWDGPVFRQA